MFRTHGTTVRSPPPARLAGIALHRPLLGASGVARPPHPSSRKAAKYEEGKTACQFARKPAPRRLLDDLVGTSEESGWDREAECVGGLEVDDQLEFGRLLDR